MHGTIMAESNQTKLCMSSPGWASKLFEMTPKLVCG